MVNKPADTELGMHDEGTKGNIIDESMFVHETSNQPHDNDPKHMTFAEHSVDFPYK
jgi:hypothetical protein